MISLIQDGQNYLETIHDFKSIHAMIEVNNEYAVVEKFKDLEDLIKGIKYEIRRIIISKNYDRNNYKVSYSVSSIPRKYVLHLSFTSDTHIDTSTDKSDIWDITIINSKYPSLECHIDPMTLFSDIESLSGYSFKRSVQGESSDSPIQCKKFKIPSSTFTFPSTPSTTLTAPLTFTFPSTPSIPSTLTAPSTSSKKSQLVQNSQPFNFISPICIIPPSSPKGDQLPLRFS